MDSRQDFGLPGENKIAHIPEQQKKDSETIVPSHVEKVHSIVKDTGSLGGVVDEGLSEVFPTSKEDLLLPGVTDDLENTSLMQNGLSSVQKTGDRKSEKSMQLIEKTIHLLPPNPQCVPPGFTEIPLPVIEKSVQLGTDNLVPLKEVVDGKMLFHEVLNELDRLKERLGGAPNFGDNTHLLLDDPDKHKTFFGIPMRAVKDWLRMVIKDKWIPQAFWRAISSIFHVTTHNLYSQYEEAHIRIQRFGMLIANKERIIGILKNNEKKRFSEFSQISDMSWHPKTNGFGTEIQYIEFVEKFLKEDFQEAKKRGDDALVKYFNAFDGLCFEDRCRNLEQFARENPTKANEDIKNLNEVIEDILDIDFNKPVAAAFDVLASVVVKKEGDVSPKTLLDEVRQQGVFDKEFCVNGGDQFKPTFKDFQDYCFERIEQSAMAPYSSVEEFLEIELEVLKNSGKEINKENFMKRLVKAAGKEIFGDEQDPFSCDAPAVSEFIQNNFSS